MRAPVNLSRLRFDRDSGLILYQPKRGELNDDNALTDPLEFLARVLIHIPEPNKHLVHFYGAYANRVRRIYREPVPHEEQGEVKPTATTIRRAANKRWRELIYRVYEVDPLTCDRCGAEMKVLALITDYEVVRRIIRASRSHLIPSKQPDADDSRPPGGDHPTPSSSDENTDSLIDGVHPNERVCR